MTQTRTNLFSTLHLPDASRNPSSGCEPHLKVGDKYRIEHETMGSFSIEILADDGAHADAVITEGYARKILPRSQSYLAGTNLVQEVGEFVRILKCRVKSWVKLSQTLSESNGPALSERSKSNGEGGMR